MLLRVGEEAVEAGCCEDIETDGEGILGVWDTSYGSYFVQVLGGNSVVLQRKLVGGVKKPMAGTGKADMAGEDFGEGAGG